MPQTMFKSTTMSISLLIDEIDRGRIGMPEMQRPFVWTDYQVRDLFDSIYNGYPVGYLLLWDDGASANTRVIGVDQKADERPRYLIIDGQQRLTSLYSAMRGKPVVDHNYKEREITISFDPIEERFAVKTVE